MGARKLVRGARRAKRAATVGAKKDLAGSRAISVNPSGLSLEAQAFRIEPVAPGEPS